MEDAAKVLLATDGSADSELAARRAGELARTFGSELHVAHVLPTSRLYSVDSPVPLGAPLLEEDRRVAEELLEKQVVRIEGLGAKVAGRYLLEGEPDAEVVALAEELGVDLIVVGGRGTGPLKARPIGSVSESIVRYAHCPVLVVREDERPAPPDP
jgi:nucleotide-binding universal stress UspA family protein